MLAGLLVGFLVSLVVILVWSFVYMVMEFDSVITNIVFCLLILFCIVSGGIIGKSYHKKQYDMYVRNWNNSKMIIEQSLQDEDLTGLERLNIVKTITQYNMQLEEMKTEVTYWWNWYLDDSAVEELDIIRID